MEVIMKKMEDLQEDKKVEISVSRVSNRQFRELLEEHGINRRPVEFTVSPTKKPVEPFVWRSDAEEAHAEDYLKWLEVNISLPDSVGFYRASSKRDLFYTSMVSNKFILMGTTDVAIVDKVCIRAKEIAAGLRVGIEGKKCVLDKDSMQTCLELISANLSSNYAVVMVLTNFGSYWRFFWLERGAIVSCDFGLQEGTALLEAIVNEAIEAGSAIQASVDTPYRARCKFNVAISQTSEEIVLPSEELVPEGLERLLQRPKVDIISMLPKRDVADMNDVFDVMTLEERNVWQRKQIFDFMMHVPAFQPSIPESWRSMYL
ncbi:hypothetical protein BC937DRAFT_95340 [Endogone sp. FLAS-F59071]|nr:hypothetical protein BC937DRAFT_95340 [Endogone sp. FLAS-F59071]|eukprot:RUS13436.1 hypothetical protein BC937DRAFT_95340 [Endogone sp. FLAS-F59071]